jgi:hypothetical protein
MKLHEKGSWFWWIIGIGIVSGWFGSDDDTKQAVVETARDTTRTVVEKVEKALPSKSGTKVEEKVAATETSYAEVARLKDLITSVIYDSAVAEITAGNEVTLKKIWPDVDLRLRDKGATVDSWEMTSFLDDNTAIVVIGGEKLVINFDADVGMVRNIEPFEEAL